MCLSAAIAVGVGLVGPSTANATAASAGLTVTDSETSPGAGTSVTLNGTIDYALDASNPGTDPTGAVTVEDSIPAGTSYVAGSASCGSLANCAASESAGTLTFTFAAPGLAGGDSGNLTFEVTVNQWATGGSTITNQADYTNLNGNCGTATTICTTSVVSNPVSDSPSISVQASASTRWFAGSGTEIDYGYLVTNTGNVTLDPVILTDTRQGAVPCPATELAPRAFEWCTGSYTTTASDVNAGEVTSTATVTGQPPAGQAAVATDTVSVPAIQAPSIGLLESSPTTSSFSGPGVSVTYHYQVTNTGNVTLNPVTVTDSQLGSISCPDQSLSPAASETCSATYTTAQADVDAGGVTSTATATGTPPAGPNVTRSASLTIPASQTPGIGLVKSSTTKSFTAAGSLITYSYQATNNGNVTLDPVTVTDPMSGLSTISCPSTALAPAVSETCIGTYTTTQADVEAGGVTNTGSATGTPPAGPNVTSRSSLSIPALVAHLVVTESSSPPSGTTTEPGNTVTYTLTFANSGTAPATVHYTDDLRDVLDDATVTAPPATTAPDLTVSPVTSNGFTIAGSEPAGTTSTATYTVKVDQPDQGNQLLANYLIPTGTTPPTSCASTNPDCSVNPVAELASPASQQGYRLVGADGGVFSFHAPFYGSLGATPLNKPIVGIATDPATGGYWLVGADGGVFSFHAPFYGSLGATPLNKPIVGIATDPATGGYWLVGADGGVFSFHAPFQGSLGATPLNKPIVGIAST